jgi:transcriptional regulator with XRE-family HTH domain
MTQKTLSRDLGVSSQYISSVETGHKPFLSESRVRRVAAILRLTAKERAELESHRLDGARQLHVAGRCTTRQYEFAALVARSAHKIRERDLPTLKTVLRKIIAN